MFLGPRASIREQGNNWAKSWPGAAIDWSISGHMYYSLGQAFEFDMLSLGSQGKKSNLLLRISPQRATEGKTDAG